MFIGAPFFMMDSLYPFDGESSPAIADVIIFSYFILEGILLLVFAIRLKKLNPRRVCKAIAIYEFIVSPLLCFLFLVLSLLFPYSYRSWICITVTIILFLILVDRIFITFYFSKAINAGNDGLVGIRNHSWITSAIFLVFFLFFFLGQLKVSLEELLIALIAFSEAEDVDVLLDALPASYYICTLIQLIFVFIALVMTLYLAFSTLISAIENRTVSLKNNAEFTKAVFKKYDVGFWFGIIVALVLMIAAFISMIQINFSLYVGLVFLYFVIIVIRVPTYFWNLRINTKYGEDTHRLFVEKHKIMVYSAVCLFIYSILSFVLGSASASKADASKSDFITFVVFVPWALFKLYIGISGMIRAHKSGDPLLYMNSRIDLMIAMFTLANTLFLVANSTKFILIYLLGLILSVILVVYCFVCSIKMFILGLRGLHGKRYRAESCFNLYYEKMKEKFTAAFAKIEDKIPLKFKKKHVE